MSSTQNPASTVPSKVVFIGIGGATSSGKTTLAKHLRDCLPDSFIIHQDDFVPPDDRLPVDPEYGFQDWDTAATAIDWDRMVSFLSDLRKTGTPPKEHRSFDSFNKTPSVPVDAEIISGLRKRSEEMIQDYTRTHKERLVFMIVDGFLMFWDERIVRDMDVRVFIRVPEDIARARRGSRSYYTPEGETWTDPPQYWEKIVWPAYINAHKHLFENDDIKAPTLSAKAKDLDLILFESMDAKMGHMVATVIDKTLTAVRTK